MPIPILDAHDKKQVEIKKTERGKTEVGIEKRRKEGRYVGEDGVNEICVLDRL